MAGEWTTLRLGNVCTKIGSGATPRGGSGVYLDQGDVALIRSQNVYNDGLHHDGLVYLTPQHADELRNVEVEEDDILLNITGDSVARACQVDADVLPARVNQHVAIIRPDPKQLWPRFLRFFLVSPMMQSRMLQLAGAGATRNALTKGMIESFEVVAPADVKEQQAIACILGSLDDKIELNRRMNRTLEAMARAIFKSWFVDFDPVHWNIARRLANIPRSEPCLPAGRSGKWFVYAIECEGGSYYIGFTDDLHRRLDEHCRGCGADWTKAHPPVRLAYWEPVGSQTEAVAREQKLKSGSGREWLKAEIARNWTPRRPLPAGRQVKPEIAALFPDAFEPSELGEIPKGWRVERFRDHITADRGLSYKGEGLRDDGSGLPMHNLNSIFEGGGYKHAGIKYYEGEYREKHLLIPGDMIVTNTEQGFDHLLIAHAAIVPECFGLRGLYSHHIYRVRCKPKSPFTPHYLVELFNNPRWHYWISGFSNGTTINMLPLDALEKPLLVVPPTELVNRFSSLAKAVHERVEDNRREAQTLATLRDALLPKLISGDLRVPDAKRIASSV